MPLRTKNRRIQTAELCKLNLREKHQAVLLFVEAFIVKNDGTGTNRTASNWREFTDSSWKNEEMLVRLDQRFQRWLNPQTPLRGTAPIRAHEAAPSLLGGPIQDESPNRQRGRFRRR